MEVTHTIELSWWPEGGRGDEIPEAVRDELDDYGLCHASKMLTLEFREGELVHEINGVSYRGWWKHIKTGRNSDQGEPS